MEEQIKFTETSVCTNCTARASLLATLTISAGSYVKPLYKFVYGNEIAVRRKKNGTMMLNTFHKFTAFDSVLEELTFRTYIYKVSVFFSGNSYATRAIIAHLSLVILSQRGEAECPLMGIVLATAMSIVQ
ncbi:hypothetical protein T11_6883 [Trichinella zimbabwensis]|uniref:Uncharacterized protein n=1 Tax=Trichinella zimbabwensis TaxID=268475 RepID=A0A0V1GX82_9BILA|nr:hypothetical protein T11_6883 [Trichinella zimbabwensis]